MTQDRCTATREHSGETIACTLLVDHAGSHQSERGHFWSDEPAPTHLLVYPEGDSDRVSVVSVDGDLTDDTSAVVRLPDGSERTVLTLDLVGLDGAPDPHEPRVPDPARSIDLPWTLTPDRGLTSRTYVVALKGTYGVPHRLLDPEPATHVQRWYNRSERSWVVSYAVLSEEFGVAQVGDSTYVATRDEAETIAARLVAEADGHDGGPACRVAGCHGLRHPRAVGPDEARRLDVPASCVPADDDRTCAVHVHLPGQPVQDPLTNARPFEEQAEQADDWGRTKAEATASWSCPGEQSEHWVKRATLDEGEWLIECGHCGNEEPVEAPESERPIPAPRADASTAPGTLSSERCVCVAVGSLDEAKEMLVSLAGAGVPTLLLQDAEADAAQRFHVAVPDDLAMSPVVFFSTLRQDVDRPCSGGSGRKHWAQTGGDLSPEQAEALNATDREHPER